MSKLVTKVTKGAFTAKIHYIVDVEEYKVSFFRDNKYLGENCNYYTSSFEDALATAEKEVEMLTREDGHPEF